MSSTAKSRYVISAGIAIAGIALAIAAVFIYSGQRAEARCERWRKDFAITSANMDKALELDDQPMIKALGREFGAMLQTEPEDCLRPPRRL
jgi:hypothetical protein